jgi:hypothetical protein
VNLGSLTPIEVMADPFGKLGTLIDLAAYLAQRLADRHTRSH